MCNANKLRAEMVLNDLRAHDIADLIQVSIYTVRAWLISPESERHRIMKPRDLDYLRAKIMLYRLQGKSLKSVSGDLKRKPSK